VGGGGPYKGVAGFPPPIAYMKTNLFLALLGVAVLAGCQSTRVEENAQTFATCTADTPIVRTATNEKGTLTYNPATLQYELRVPQAGTAVDLGVVCGELLDTWRSGPHKVTFSGAFREYRDAPPAPAGYTTYHLELTKLNSR
jgi:hypothetical protein